MISEVWKEIEGYSNYRISNLGRVKRIEIIGWANQYGVVNRLKERVMKGSFSKDKGWHVMMTNDDGKQKYEFVSRLLLSAFDRPSKEGEVARHLDDNKHNQSLGNLEWGTRKDNGSDAVRNGRYKGREGLSNSNSKLTEEQVFEIRKTCIKYSKEFGREALAKKYKVSHAAILAIVKGTSWSHI